MKPFSSTCFTVAWNEPYVHLVDAREVLAGPRVERVQRFGARDRVSLALALIDVWALELMRVVAVAERAPVALTIAAPRPVVGVVPIRHGHVLGGPFHASGVQSRKVRTMSREGEGGS